MRSFQRYRVKAMSDPTSFPRRILVAVTGLSPQIVTETLFALAVQQQPAFVPTEVHLITTREGSKRARLSLLSETPGGFHSLCADYHLSGIHFGEENIHVLSAADGESLDDIRTPEDNRRAADLITSILRELTMDPDSAVHVSIAGGRKTMGFFVGYALTLFGRPQDRLSHVLVSSPFESSYRFFYPTPKTNVIDIGNGVLADSATAVVTLADIPFVGLRHGLPDMLLTGESTYVDTVDAARRSIGPTELTIDLAKNTVSVFGASCQLPRAELAMLMVFVRRTLEGKPPICAPSKEVCDKEWSDRFLKELCALRGTVDDTDATEKALKNGMDGSYFSQNLSRLRKDLHARLKTPRVRDLIIDGNCRPRRYQLSLPASAIRIIKG